MRTIWKYPLERAQFSEIEVPMLTVFNEYCQDFGIQVLKFDIQYETPTIWVMCETDAPIRKVKIRMVGTGWNCDELSNLNHIATYIDNAGFVWHYFYE